MRTIMAGCMVFVGATSGAGAYEAPPVEPGFVSLFDGKNIAEHFVIKGKKESWQVADDVIRSTPGGDRIMSKKQYGDFVLRLEWKVSKNGNSGVFVRVPSPDDGAPWETGYEVQISNAPRDDAHCTGSLYGVVGVKPRPDEAADVWHAYEITCRGGRVTVVSDGVRCIDARSEQHTAMRKRPRKGYIGLQDSHSGAGSTIEYRNIRIQELLPDGTAVGFTSLTRDGRGWHKNRERIGHGTGGQWTFVNGAWIGEQDPPGSGNGGILLTDKAYGDFELIIETKPDWGVCSGIFLRSTEKGQCYQIMVDYHGGGNVGSIYGEGTGGFSNRNYQIKDDKTIELLTDREGAIPLPFKPAAFPKHWRFDDYNEIRARVTGNPPTIDVWLNGTYITHFEDDKKRLPDTGRVAIQVHGGGGWPKGTRVRFRNIQVRELK